MPNNYFKFKQFTINQDRCAMKVTSLACIQGAWLPEFKPNYVLDIGAGTGLLTLMAAQKYNAQFDAVEIDDLAYGQLSENTQQSPWSDKIACHHRDILDFAKENSRTYDFIISNPPFYKAQLKSADRRINQARHETSLTLKELVEVAEEKISPNGIISILLPIRESEILMDIVNDYSISPINQLIISDNLNNPPKAAVTYLSKETQNHISAQLIIKDGNNELSKEYKTLLRPYYLNL